MIVKVKSLNMEINYASQAPVLLIQNVDGGDAK
jgi:hypothetical protein